MKSLKISLEESGIENAIIAADKGFYSRDNINLLRKEGLKFIMPLKRNNKLIDYSPLRKRDKRKMDGYFKFNERHIWYYRKKRDSLRPWCI